MSGDEGTYFLRHRSKAANDTEECEHNSTENRDSSYSEVLSPVRCYLADNQSNKVTGQASAIDSPEQIPFSKEKENPVSAVENTSQTGTNLTTMDDFMRAFNTLSNQLNASLTLQTNSISEELTRQRAEAAEQSAKITENLNKMQTEVLARVDYKISEFTQHVTAQIHNVREEAQNFRDSVTAKFTSVEVQMQCMQQSIENAETVCQDTARRVAEETITQTTTGMEIRFAYVQQMLQQHETDTTQEFKTVINKIERLESFAHRISLHDTNACVVESPSTQQPDRHIPASPLRTDNQSASTANVKQTTAKGQGILVLDAATTINHPARHWAEEMPTFSAKTNENPRKFLKSLDEYANRFNLTESEKMRCLSSCLKSTAYYWWEVHQGSTESYNEFCQLFLRQHWSMKIQGNLRAQLHSEKFDPKRGRSLEAHLSDMFERTRYLDIVMNDEEFIALILGQLPMRYQLHLSGRNFENISDFREQLLAYDRLDRQSRANTNVREEGERQPQNKQPPLYQPWVRRNDNTNNTNIHRTPQANTLIWRQNKTNHRQKQWYHDNGTNGNYRSNWRRKGADKQPYPNAWQNRYNSNRDQTTPRREEDVRGPDRTPSSSPQRPPRSPRQGECRRAPRNFKQDYIRSKLQTPQYYDDHGESHYGKNSQSPRNRLPPETNPSGQLQVTQLQSTAAYNVASSTSLPSFRKNHPSSSLQQPGYFQRQEPVNPTFFYSNSQGIEPIRSNVAQQNTNFVATNPETSLNQ
ncbi:uncharacterized protein LOC134528576 isoform X1 [Bacillus rossius redtenbacheri]|uniref:uncharacterized protein LOC134528576 isoform X1 n=1 Tax=Bacillus rossius redtenbacheri TaxID=93214 RepID=UPI002FDE07D3